MSVHCGPSDGLGALHGRCLCYVTPADRKVPPWRREGPSKRQRDPSRAPLGGLPPVHPGPGRPRAVILMAPPKRWMDGINRNPELNKRAADYESKYPQYPPTDKTTGEEIMDPNHWRTASSPLASAERRQAVPVHPRGPSALAAQTVATVDLAGYMGAR